ncbi:sterol desaturase family protein [Gordonia sp. VNQ95]|uniref:sterol desaturase family protein n=1 Tax=Gordonia sp. VNQ95 TaxID=3156619 RepID=UPI0032B594A2
MSILATIWEHIENPLVYAIPFFFALLIAEAVMLVLEERREAKEAAERTDGGVLGAAPARTPKTGYSAADTRTSLFMGSGALIAMLVFKSLTLVLFVFIWTYIAPWQIPVTWWSWILLFVAVDLTWYCNHRFSHRVRIGWAAHQAHHSSEYFNLGTALRQKWNPWSEAIFWLPLPLLGFTPWTIYVAFAFNLIYQFFSHTETIGRLPRPIELVMNTPSHHRVHHASDAEYLDKNYGGIFIIWDRMFGTFQPELHTPKYGLTKPVTTYNPFKLEYFEYANIARDLRSAQSWSERLGYVFAPPGWQPKRLRQSEAQTPSTMVADKAAAVESV